MLRWRELRRAVRCRQLAAATIDVACERGIQSRRNLSAPLSTSQPGLHLSAVSVREVIEAPEDQKYGGHGRPPHDRPGDMDVVGGRLPWKRPAGHVG